MRKNGGELGCRLEKIIKADDKARFVKLLQDHPSEVTKCLVDKCVDYGARKCLVALLRGQVSNLYPQLDARVPESGVTALAYVAHSCPDSEVIKSMLARCGAVPLANVCCTIGLVHGLPIQFLLINLSFKEYLYNWKRGDSLIKLVMLLCLWKTKPVLDSACLLAQHTDSVNEIAWTFLKKGGLKQFVALLLIAREKVMAPFDTGSSIHDCIDREIDLITGDDLSVEEKEHRCIFTDAKKLLAVFEKAGDALTSYCSSMKDYVPAEEAVTKITRLLQNHRVHVDREDLFFHNEFRGHRGLSRLNKTKMSGPFDNDCVYANPSQTPHERFRTLPYRRWFTEYDRHTAVPIPERLASLASQPRLYSTRAYQARNISNSVPCTGGSPLPRNLAHFTMKLVKGFRVL